MKLLRHDRAEPLQEGAPLDTALQAWGKHHVNDRLCTPIACTAYVQVYGDGFCNAYRSRLAGSECLFCDGASMLCSQKLVNYPHFVLSPPAVMKVLSEGPCTMCVVVLQPVWCAMCGIGVLLLVQLVIVQRPSMSQLKLGLAVCAGPGDTLALLGLALAYDFTAYVWVPWGQPHQPRCDAQEPASATGGVQQGASCTQEEITSQVGQLPLHSVDADRQGAENAVEPCPARLH